MRPGSEQNRAALRALGVALHHADIRLASDFETLPAADVVVDAAANPSVLAGIDGHTSSRQLVEHNLVGTVNVLEYCRRHRATLVMLSTSRVYSLDAPGRVAGARCRTTRSSPTRRRAAPAGLTAQGVDETFSTRLTVSLYGATKLASEQLALEYGSTFGFPSGSTGVACSLVPDSSAEPTRGSSPIGSTAGCVSRPLRYIGFGGQGHQVRDCLHPADIGSADRAANRDERSGHRRG